MLFFCRLKINHMKYVHNCVFMLAGTRTVTAKKSLRDCVPRGFPYVALCKVILNHAISAYSTEGHVISGHVALC